MSVEPSDGGWSEVGDAPERRIGPTDDAAAPEARYAPLDEVGEGGMGRVLSVLDRQLGREVAWKEIPVDRAGAGAASRLAHEAAITARLEHPGIVPVYDTGVVDGARRYYTMRLVRGRTLGQALADAGDLSARLALLPHFYAVCQAVAFAHSRGVAHRDLKPDNVMVGAYGETFVVDWGLAALYTDAARRAARRDLGEGVPEVAPGPVGTPAWVSPEQASGAPAGPRADVFGLGGILLALLSGAPPRHGVSTLEAAAHAPPADPEAVAPAAPIELRAVARRALSVDPGDRYADAGELAEDVARYLDGRRVQAHAYSTWQLARRFVRAWRAPLLVGLAALVGLVVVGVVALRATQAELEAASREEATLAWALHGRAQADLRAGSWPEASIIAAAALQRQELPASRGVLAATMVAAAPTRERLGEIPRCDRLALSVRGDRFACVQDGQVTVRETANPARVHLEVPEVPVHILPLASTLLTVDAQWVVRLHRAGGVDRIELGIYRGLPVSGPRGRYALAIATWAVLRVDSETGEQRTLERPCPAGARASAHAVSASGRVAVACESGRLMLLGPEPEAVEQREIPFDTLRPASVMAFVGDAELVIGGLDGSVVWVGAEGRQRAVGQGRGRVELLAPMGSEGRVAVQRTGSGIELWDLASGVELGRLPSGERRGLAADSPSSLVTGGAHWSRWRYPPTLAPVVIEAPAGLSHVAISPDGALLAAGRGDGWVSVWRADTGALVAERKLSPRGVKWGAFTDDGRYLAALVVERGVALLGAGALEPIESRSHGHSLRRVGVLANGMAFGLTYQGGLDWWRPGEGEVARLGEAELRASDVDPGRRRAVLLAVSGEVWELREGGELILLGEVVEARCVAADPGVVGAAGVRTSGGAVVATGGELVTLGPGGATRRVPLPGPMSAVDLAVSPDGRWVAIGNLDGSVEVLDREGARRALLLGHRDRVADVVFADATTLLSASWDRTVRRWQLSVLDADAGTLASELQRSWGLAPGSAVGGSAGLRDL